MIHKPQELESRVTSELKTEPVVLCAADDNYVKPLAVALQSAAQQLRIGNRLRVIVLDGGISAEHWMGLKESLADLPIELLAIRPNLDDVRRLGVSHHITHTAYLRLLAGRLLPESIDKVIYLDSDVLVCEDLSVLWNIPLDGNFALAVPDVACPFIDTRHADCNFSKSSPYLAAISPVANWRQLGLDPSAPYFNSGVMVLNVKRMREERIEQRLLSCLNENKTFVWCWDQYALNVVFAGQWKPLPLKWNQGAHIFEFPNPKFSPLNSAEFLEAKHNPAIIHFTTEWKPWDFGSRHPLADRFFEQLDQTAWSGWRPNKPEFSIARSWQTFATEFTKQSVIHYRKMAGLFRSRKLATAVDVLPQSNQLCGDHKWATNAQPNFDLSEQLTFFAIPKPFAGNVDIAQRNAINSWKLLAPFADIILLGDEEGIAETAAELNVRHVAGLQTNEYGTPLLSSAFRLVRENSEAPYLAYCNCDIILFSDFAEATTRLILNPDFDQFVATSQRTNLSINKLIDFGNKTEVARLISFAKTNGKRESLVCKDFFVFPRQLFGEMPDFVVGRGNWDNWIVHNAKLTGVPVISVSECVLTLHQPHDYSHVGSRISSYVSGKEAEQNLRLAKGRHLISGSTCDFRLNENSLRPGRMQFVGGEFWVDFPRFVRLLLDFVGIR